MATTTLSTSVPLNPGRTPYRLSVAQYHKMSEAGILKGGDKVELLEGLLVEKKTRNPPQATAITLLYYKLISRLPDGWTMRLQCPITTTDSEPDPAVAVVSGDARLFMQRHPGSRDIALVIEVADSTLAQDRTDKLRIYARARLPIYWIVNIPESQIEVYTQPRAGRNPTYRQRRDYLPTETIPLVIAGQTIGSIAVHDLLP